MKIYKLHYFANFYSNGGNWTHVVKVYNEDYQAVIIGLEEDKAVDIKYKMQGFLSGNCLMQLRQAMKYREDYRCSLLLSDKDCEYLKIIQICRHTHQGMRQNYNKQTILNSPERGK